MFYVSHSPYLLMGISWLFVMTALLTDSTKVSPVLLHMSFAVDGLPENSRLLRQSSVKGESAHTHIQHVRDMRLRISANRDHL
ncbi:hypothetical protein IW261DRAFT_1479845 [Armillaria novae-zelandiae]|uniref:Uncharacterized protein n=1 Tax=Armillaria novae-zelandiae TaxID=153914 RepID=A0AA39P8E7_9AGAR|nr:hypothetical protein IW261DRAFT_1479845 [Armillaria novae-zelandiae]